VGNEPTYRFFLKPSVMRTVVLALGTDIRGDAPSVAPIEGTQLRIRVLELKRQFVSCADAAGHRVTHFGLLVFETIGQRDAGPAFLAGRRAFDGLDFRLGDSRDPNRCGPLLAIDSEGDRGEELLHQIGSYRSPCVAPSRGSLAIVPPRASSG
jgi:hypothetical protein